MRKILIALILLSVGCTSTPPLYNSEIIKIDPLDIEKYWIFSSSTSREIPKLASTGGEWTFEVTIDSNGKEWNKTLISSNPVGFMTQRKLDKLNNNRWKAAPSNQKRQPVSIRMSVKILPKKV
ncbi:hypothetical protein [Thalassotalea sp. ND16A]|uniref:hypothetical protein n=1 Tax=Thalassotalea sp. ND16A TaxID=1535422 RepID=UPI00051A8439|nr:hypothetical protein [Thalassotalea sp. ND16A]KGJ93505.1 hypothetical protein ND16A_1480 [Thalassotalea sp. ND16A]